MKFIYCLFLTVLFACTRQSAYKDRAADKNDSFQITKQFYDGLQQRDLDKIFDLFNFSKNESEALTQKKSLFLSLRATREKFGDIRSYDIVSNNTKVIDSENGKTGEYRVVVRIRRYNTQKIFEDKFVIYLMTNRLLINNYDSSPL